MTGHDVDRYLYQRARSRGAVQHARPAVSRSFWRGVLSALLIYLAIFAGALGFWVALNLVEAVFRRG